jgi:hypothetical protein
MLNERGRAFLEARGIEIETAVRFELYTTSRPDGAAEPTEAADAQFLAIPYFEGGVQVDVRFRDLREDCPHEERYRSQKGAKPRIFNRDVIADDPGLLDEPLIITEGELDAIAAAQSGRQRVIGIPGAKLAALLDDHAADLAEINDVTLATDSDEAGIALRGVLADKIGEAKCKFLPAYPKGCKDLGDTLARYGKAGVTATFDRAQYVPVSGLHGLDDLPARPPLEVVKVNAFGADFYRHIGICKRQLSLWTGEPGGGKSTIVKALMWALTRQKGWKHAGGFFEDDAQSHTVPDLMRLYMGRELENSPLADEARGWVRDNFLFIMPREDEPPTVEWFLQRAEAAVRRHGVEFVLVDPWSEFDLNLDGRVPETEKIRKYLIALRHFARRFNVHVAVIAHPRKHNEWGGTKKMAEGNDVAGSLHFKARCDLGVTVQSDPVCKGLSNIKVWKSRRWKEMGEPGEFSLIFHPTSGRFSPVTAEIAAEMRGDDPKVVAMKTRKPVAQGEVA